MDLPQLYYTLAQLSYTVASVNKGLDKNEKRLLKDIYVFEMEKTSDDYDYSEIISHVLQKERKEFDTTYNWAVQSLRLYRSNISLEFKDRIIKLITRIVEELPPLQASKDELLEQFKLDLEQIVQD